MKYKINKNKNKKQLKKKLVPLMIGSMIGNIGVYYISPTVAHATSLSTYDQNRMLGATTEDWQSANLREWLNSNKEVVDYTGIKPSYQNEKGFLSSSNFTQAEYDAISVTRHGLGSQYSLSGNVNETLYFSQRSVAHNDYVSNDKVFILHYTDLVNYIEKNKQLMNMNKKYFSNYLQSQTNKKDKYNYVVNSGYYNNGYTGVSVLYTSTLTEIATQSQQNIVPALSLKPNYVLSNGVTARDLVVGDIVRFGKYNGEPIEWQVINKSDNGYPLLWSTKILTTKEYDAPGDINPRTSNHINFNSYDVDIFSNSQAKSWETKNSIDSSTEITILNDSALTTPTNNTEILLKIKATDSKYGIRKITLPDGTVVNGDYAEWTLKENGEYDILVENAIGVITVKHIITKAINTPAEVRIATDKDESTKWSNKPVNVSISSTNKGIYTLTAPGRANMGYSSSSTGVYPSWMPLGGKKLRVTGTFKNVLTDAEASQIDMNAEIRIRLTMKWYNSSQVGYSYPIIKSVSLKELKQKGEIVVDEIYTIPENAYNYVTASIQLMDSNTAYMKDPYKYGMSDFQFEIVDKDDLAIEEITLPNGNKVYSDTANYVISTDGTYVFATKDNRGNTTSKAIEVAIDTGKPVIDISGVKTEYVNSQVLQIKATDTLSGIKRIKLPNGEYRTTAREGESLTIDYNIIKNGTYTFEAEDYAGNITLKTISISNIDTTPPSLNTVASSTKWTNEDVTIQVTASDSDGEIDYIQLPNGNKIYNSTVSYKVSQNGTYKFITQDKMGRQASKSITVSNIDKNKPTVQHDIKYISGKNYSLILKTNDTESGIKRITMPSGEIVTTKETTLTVTEGQEYEFKIEDNAGNVENYKVSVDTPELNVYQKDNHVKAEWATEILDQDVLYVTGFENGEELPNLTYGGQDKAGGTTGGQSFINNEFYSGLKSLRIVDTYTNGQHAGNADLNGVVPFSNFSRAIFSKKNVENGMDLAVSFRAKTDGKGVIRPTSSGEVANYGSPLDITFLEDVKVGDKTVKVSNPTYFKNFIDAGTRFYLANQKGKYKNIYVTSVDMQNSTITVNSPFEGTFTKGDAILKHVVRTPVNFPSRTITNNEWELFNVNTTVEDFEDYNALVGGFSFSLYTETNDIVYIDEVKMGYATKTRLYRGNTMVYEGYLSDYEDREATDKEAPNNIKNINVFAENNKVVLSFAKPEDKGSKYEYRVEAISNKGDTISSETKEVTVKTGIKGYSYVVDKNPTTIPDNKVDVTTEKFEVPINTNEKYYIHVKTIDVAGNISDVAHFSFQDSVSPTLTLTKNMNDWTNMPVQITAKASDNELLVKHIKLPNSNLVTANTATYTVSENGTYVFEAEDLVGNKTTKSIVISNIDKTPPSPSVISNNTDWINALSVPVTINSGTDNQSGVNRVEYKLEEATIKGWTTYTGAFHVNNEGITKIIARTVDNMGHVSTETTSYVKIDRSKPYNQGITIHLKNK